MGKDFKKKYTVSLDIDTKDAETQIKTTVGNLKIVLAQLGTASDKMTYFKEAAGYLSQIDSQLSNFKQKYGEKLFDQMFGGLDTNFQKELEGVFGVAKEQLTALEQLKEKVTAAKNNGATTGADLKPLEQEIKSLYEAVGMLDKLDLSGKGKVETRIKKLEAAINGFAVIWDGLNNKLKQGLNLGKTDNTGGIDNINKLTKIIKQKVKEFYDELIGSADPKKMESIKSSLKDALSFDEKDFIDFTNIFKGLEDASLEEDEAVKQMVAALKKIKTAKQEVNQVLQNDTDINNKMSNNIEQETNDTIKVIDIAKKKLVAAWKQYFNDVEEAKKNGYQLEKGDSSMQMDTTQSNINQMLGEWGAKATKGKYKTNVGFALDLSDDIIYGDIGIDDIENKVNEMFQENGITVDIPLEQISLDTAKASDTIMTSIDQAEVALKEFLDLVNEIKNKSFEDSWDATDNIEIGKYTERLNNAKTVLDELGKQGKLTAEQLEQVNNAFNEANADLSSKTQHYDSFASYNYYDEYQEEQNKVAQLESENQDLKNQLNAKQTTMANETQQNAQEMVSSLTNVQDEVVDVNGAFQQLVDYISKSWNHPKTFFNNLVSGAQQVDEELRNILQSLNLIDTNGKMKFTTPNAGFSNSGGMISDDYVLISRDESKLPFSLAAKEKTAAAKAMGANIGAVLDIYEDKANGIIYELQNKVSGKGILDFKKGITNTEFLEATDEQVKKLIEDLLILQKTGLYVDWNGDNILYDKDKGFSFIDFFTDSVTPYTVGKDNTVQENLNEFFNKIFSLGGINSNKIGQFQSHVNNLVNEVINKNNIQQTSATILQDVQTSSSAVTNSIQKEGISHEQNTEAINAENKALQAQIELKKKAQSMTWESFALDESLSDLKDIMGFKDLSDMEYFWKQANYDKDIDFREISQSEIENVFNSRGEKFAYLADKWYGGSQDFDAKNQLENMVLADNELRNAMLNKLYGMYKNYQRKIGENILSFGDFLTSEIEVFRGDGAPLLFNENQKLSASFDPDVALSFANGVKEDVKSTKIIPGKTIGNASWSSSEKEVFMPNSHLPYLNDIGSSFEDYYNGLTSKQQKDLDNILIQLEKNRVKNLLGKDILTQLKSFKDDNTIEQFKQGIVPSKIDGTGNNNFENLYNNLSEIQKKLVAYYVSLSSALKSFENNYINYEDLGKTDVVNAVMGKNSKEGLKQHVNNLTGESKFKITTPNSQFDWQESGVIQQEAAMHQQNTQAIQQEQQAQEALNKTKIDAAEVLNKLNDLWYDAPAYSDEEMQVNNLKKYVDYIETTPNQEIKDGYSISSDTGELFSYSELLKTVEDFEQEYGKNLDFLKDYLNQVFSEYISNLNQTTVDIQSAAQDSIVSDGQEVVNKLLTSSLGDMWTEKFSGWKNIIDQIEKVNATQNDKFSSILKDGYFEDTNTGELLKYTDLLNTIQDFEQNYNEDLSYVKDYLEKVFSEYLVNINAEIDKIVGVAPEKEILSEREVTDKLAKKWNQLVAIDDNAQFYAMDTIADKFEAVKQTGQGFIDSGKFLMDGDEYDYADLLNLITDYEQQYNENLDFLKNYLEQVFANFLSSAEQQTTEIQNIASENKFKDGLEVQDKLSEALDQVSGAQFNALDEIYDQVAGIKYTDSDLIDSGKFLNLVDKECDYADLLDAIDTYEQKYGESLDYVKDYLKQTFANYDAELDKMLGIVDYDDDELILDGFDSDSSSMSTNSQKELQVQQDITAEKQKQVALDKQSQVDTSTEMQSQDIQAETTAIDGLQFKINEVEQAVADKTAAFINEGTVVDQVMQQEIAEVQTLLDTLQEVTQIINGINNSSIDENAIKGSTASSIGDYALETTLVETNNILNQILTALGNNESLAKMVEPLSTAVAELKNVANGIVQHQQAQKSDTSVAMAKIADIKQNQQIVSIAENSLSGLSSEVEIKSLTALADGLVKVNGAFKNANGEWEGFTVKVNQANEAVDLAIDKQSAFAKSLNKTAGQVGEEDANLKAFDKDKVIELAQGHLEELTKQGKNATIQFKDSGRYTITILEEIDGLSKQIFQTFDENDEKIERTTATISNDQKIKLENLKSLIETGVADNFVGDKDTVYQQYQKANQELENMNELYRVKENLSSKDIATWNAQIKLVQQLASDVEKLIQKRKVAVESEAFKSDRGKKLSKYDLDLADLKTKINIPDSFNRQLEDARKAIESAADSDSLKIAVNNWEALKNKIKQTATEQDLFIKKSKETKNTTPDKFTKDLDKQKDVFAKYKVNLGDVSKLSQETQQKLADLEIALNNISDTDGLNQWVKSFSDLKTEIANTQKATQSAQLYESSMIKGQINAKFKELDFKVTDANVNQEQQKLLDTRKQLIQAIAEYEIKVKSGQEAELDGINRIKNALFQEIEAYKQKNNIINVNGKSQKAYGTSAVLSATGKYNMLKEQASSAEFDGSGEIAKRLNQYTAAYQKLLAEQKKVIAIQNQLKPGESLTNEQLAGFKQAQMECNKYATELNKAINANKKFAESAENVTKVNEDFADTTQGRQKALQDYVQVQYGATAKVGEFDRACEKLTFTIDNGNGTFTQMVAAINPARNAIGTMVGETEKATTAFGRFFDELKGKAKSIFAYLISSMSMQEVWQQIRQGVQYVREIDSALTELKKVTDETDATYEKFLQTAAKTSNVIGSTVSDFTNATADFARLGYNLEQATSLAEAASVYKNVGDGIDNISDASESIISTMKAFGIEAENAMGIVDRFNEIGNNFAISSTGIGEAMQRSASALYEAGNTIDESVALITAAMKNWLFIQKCIKRMHLIAGKSLESYKPQHS